MYKTQLRPEQYRASLTRAVLKRERSWLISIITTKKNLSDRMPKDDSKENRSRHLVTSQKSESFNPSERDNQRTELKLIIAEKSIDLAMESTLISSHRQSIKLNNDSTRSVDLLEFSSNTLPYDDLAKLSLSRFSRTFFSSFLLAITIGLVCLQAASPVLLKLLEPILFSLGALLIGIPHGAIDFLVDGGFENKKPSLFFIIRYLSIAASYFIFWLAFPNAAILFFIIYSAWHFGECDMQEWKLNHPGTIKTFTWGALLLTILLLGHVEETNALLRNMNVLCLPLGNTEGRLVGCTLAFVSIIWSLFEKRSQMFITSIILMIVTQLPLLTSFGLYFIGQHSYQGWSHLKHGLNATNKTLFLKALPLTIGALLLFLSALLMSYTGWLNAFNGDWLTVFFVFISCVSFPHVISMNFFYRKQHK